MNLEDIKLPKKVMEKIEKMNVKNKEKVIKQTIENYKNSLVVY